MSLASAAGVLLKPQTPLQQLLEDINFQRTKEMRQLLKDDSGFVVLQGTTYWTDLFVRHFLFQNEPEQSIDSDDLLFFVRKKHVKSSSRHQPKFETEVEVFRKDSRKLPIGDPDVDWEETVYLNMVIHQFDYTLTLAICTRTSPKELQVLRRHSQRVYASPSRRKMDTKGEGEEITYPHICFMVDNFDEVFSDILVRDGEMVCVELVANDKNGCIQGVIFLGSIRYDALKKVYDARQSSLSSKVAQRMSFGLFSSGAAVQTRCEFVRMKGPQGKGHAEMAVTKPKGSGVETPTSEPGFCATDIWDDWEDENDDYCTYRHQRRLSDPSANLNNFTRYTWRTKNVQDVTGTSAGVKARSENEGLDSIANEVSEIEAGDLRDDRRPAFSVSEVKLHEHPKNTANAACTPDKDNKCAETTHNISCNGSPNVSEVTEATMVLSPTLDKNHSGCGGCFGGSGSNKKCKSWAKSGVDKNTPEMSEIYCPTCDDRKNETPACLNKMPDKKMLPKNETELKNSRLNLKTKERKSATIARSASLSVADRRVKKQFENVSKTKEKIKMKEKDKFIDKDLTEKPKKEENDIKKKSVKTSILAKVSPKRLRAKNKEAANVLSLKESSKIHEREAREQLNPKTEEYEIADDATSLNADELNVISSGFAKMAILKESDTKSMINVRGKEELPVVEDANLGMQSQDNHVPNAYKIKICKNVPEQSDTEPLNLNVQQNDNLSPQVQSDEPQKFNQIAQCLDNNRDDTIISDSSKENDNAHKTLLHDKHTAAQQTFFNKAISFVPKKRTPDGTNIYYWCDLPKRALKELDDGAYNPLWASRGFTQSFHFWKEHRRQQSVPLNAFLTYVTLPWWSIAKDLLDHRETPILTF